MEICSNAIHFLCLDDKNAVLTVTRARLVLAIKKIYIFIYIYATTMCIKQNHCMNQQGSVTLVSESLGGVH